MNQKIKSAIQSSSTFFNNIFEEITEFLAFDKPFSSVNQSKYKQILNEINFLFTKETSTADLFFPKLLSIWNSIISVLKSHSPKYNIISISSTTIDLFAFPFLKPFDQESTLAYLCAFIGTFYIQCFHSFENVIENLIEPLITNEMEVYNGTIQYDPITWDRISNIILKPTVKKIFKYDVMDNIKDINNRGISLNCDFDIYSFADFLSVLAGRLYAHQRLWNDTDYTLEKASLAWWLAFKKYEHIYFDNDEMFENFIDETLVEVIGATDFKDNNLRNWPILCFLEVWNNNLLFGPRLYLWLEGKILQHWAPQLNKNWIKRINEPDVVVINSALAKKKVEEAKKEVRSIAINQKERHKNIIKWWENYSWVNKTLYLDIKNEFVNDWTLINKYINKMST